MAQAAEDVILSETSDTETDTEETSSIESPPIIIRVSRSTVSLLTSCAINLFLPFINGMMLGFGEIFAHELGFRWGFTGARVSLLSSIRSYPLLTPLGPASKTPKC